MNRPTEIIGNDKNLHNEMRYITFAKSWTNKSSDLSQLTYFWEKAIDNKYHRT